MIGMEKRRVYSELFKTPILKEFVDEYEMKIQEKDRIIQKNEMDMVQELIKTVMWVKFSEKGLRFYEVSIVHISDINKLKGIKDVVTLASDFEQVERFMNKGE